MGKQRTISYFRPTNSIHRGLNMENKNQEEKVIIGVSKAGKKVLLQTSEREVAHSIKLLTMCFTKHELIKLCDTLHIKYNEEDTKSHLVARFFLHKIGIYLNHAENLKATVNEQRCEKYGDEL